MSDCSAIEVFGTTCKTECAFTEANMNHGRWWVCSTVHLRGEYMPTDCIVRCWAEGLDSLLGTYFGGDNKLNRNFEKVTNRVANLNQKWEVTRSLTSEVMEANAPFSRVVIDQAGRPALAIVSGREVFRLSNGLSVYSSEYFRLIKRRHVLSLQYLNTFLISERFSDSIFCIYVSLTKIHSWIKRRLRKDAFLMECWQTLSVLHSDNDVGRKCTIEIYWGLAEWKSDNVRWETRRWLGWISWTLSEDVLLGVFGLFPESTDLVLSFTDL